MVLQKTDLCLDIHSLVTIYAPDLPFVVKNLLISRLGLFEVFDKPETVDIMVLALPPKQHLTLPDSSLYDFWLNEYQGEQAITFTYRGEGIVTIVFSDSLKILYRPVKKIAEQLYTILLYCIHLVLVGKNSLLFHGALAVSNDKKNALILTGPRGSKKTSLLLNLLRDGWHYVSDDKFILSNKSAYLFQTFSVLCEHHIDSLPWLLELNPTLAKLNRWKRLRRGVKKLATQHLPAYFLPPLERYYDRTLMLPMENIFKDIEIINNIKPNIVVVLAFGLNFEIKAVSGSDMLSEIATIQSLPFYQFFRFEKILSLINSSYTINLQPIITDNMKDLVFFKLTVPFNYDIDNVYNELKKCLEAVL